MPTCVRDAGRRGPTLIDALEGAGIRFILVKHENAGGFMAEGVHHRDDAPGILVATIGPGAMNCVNVVANALQDRVPLIVLTGAVDADEAHTYTHQVMDHGAVFAPVTKASLRFTSDAAFAKADKAVAIATDPRPGPVHVDVPIGVADARVDAADIPGRAPSSPVAPAPGPPLERARRALSDACRPLMIAGLDAVNEHAGAAVADTCRRFGVPLITTYKAKGLMSEDEPLAMGGAGLSPLADAHLLPLVAAADTVLCVGYDPIEMRAGWRNAVDPRRQEVIDIAAAENRHFMHQGSINFVAGCAETLRAITDGLVPRETWLSREPAKAKAALAIAFPRDEAWGPAAAIDECWQALPTSTLATADSGAHRILLSQMWVCRKPRGLMQSSAFCTMGCAVPLAIGAALAEPDRCVVAFTGDAGFLMVAGELATAAELGVRPIIVVFVDARLALIGLKQRSRGFRNVGVDFARPDVAATARAFGGHGVTARDRETLRAAVADAQDADRFTVIAVEIERGDYDGRI